jgi:virginiamycin B lyase
MASSGTHRDRIGSALATGLATLTCLAALSILAVAGGASAASLEARIVGHVSDAGGPVVGAMVTFRHGSPAHTLTVFSDASGAFQSPPLDPSSEYSIRVRRTGWRDLRIERQRSALAPPPLDLTLVRETDPSALAAQLPANVWYQLVLERLDDDAEREELKQQCTYCHQQGNWATRRARDEDQWRKVLLLMGRRGATISRDLREKMPGIFVAAYAPENALPRLTTNMQSRDFVPSPGPEVRRSVVEEWELGGRASVQHDLMVHPDGRIYSVDMSQDILYRLDPAAPDGDRRKWTVPHGDLEPGGVFATSSRPTSTSNSYVGPHSLQTAPDGSVWITLATGNQLARFDPRSESWTIHELDAGIYPHTLRFDARGRIWYTMAASNHVGLFDPANGDQRHVRLPSSSFQQAVALRMLPFLLWVEQYVDLRGQAAEGDGFKMPVPYGIDIAPDGGVWFSQLNEHQIGRIDPETLDVEMLKTPFPTPRRLRFDSQGQLWIPSFSGSELARFDPTTRRFESWPIPIEPLGSETPYALHVRRSDDSVWICGTNSDTLIRFDPGPEKFTVYPLPSRVTYTREVDFDAQGRVWTSNSNGPTWQIEGGVPQVIRLDVREAEGFGLSLAEDMGSVENMGKGEAPAYEPPKRDSTAATSASTSLRIAPGS